MPAAAPFIGVFDSGVGGLSVLRALRERLPHAALVYVADSGYAPYGERSAEFVLERSRRITQHLLQQGATGVVVACNTATAIAVRALRAARPEVAFIGVEPGLKPAAALTRSGRIGVMATTGTLASDKFKALVRAQRPGLTIVARPCPGLAGLVEQADLDSAELLDALAQHCAALRAADVDTVVLGCTHYAFVRHHIEREMGPGVRIIDTADAVARHAAQKLGALAGHATTPLVRLHTTGDAASLRSIAAAWLPFACSVENFKLSDALQ